jgi:hypothetical protein
MLLMDIQSWWLASLGLDVFVALCIVEWLRAVGSRTMGAEYSSTLLPATGDQLDACVAQISVGLESLNSLRGAPRRRSLLA